MKAKIEHPDLMKIEEAAERLGIHKDTVRAGLISKEFDFGKAVKCKRSYSYTISRKRFETWLQYYGLK